MMAQNSPTAPSPIPERGEKEQAYQRVCQAHEQLAAALQAAREAGVPERRLAARFWVQRATMLKLIDSAA